MALSQSEREAFLAEPHVAALSVAGGPDRAPLTVPIWYEYEPGGQLTIITPTGSPKHRLIWAAGRFTMMVDRVHPTVRYVSVEGPVTGEEPMVEPRIRALAGRYLPPEGVGPYVEYALATHPDRTVITMRPQRWLSADLGPGA